ncbi:MAG TPA: WhiB family transcriptional regulator [Mycobacteriales bacterium]|nr:WhiB family transcriptional regulator [Mycobacteriales bacterium]
MNAWIDEAACRGMDTELFFAPPGGGGVVSSRRALLVCESCPVQANCLHLALDNGEQYGVWGGTTPEQREPLVRARRVS